MTKDLKARLKRASPLPPGALVGMVHLGASPGSPGGGESVKGMAQRAAEEAGLLADAGFDAVMIENMHDAPYVHGEQGPEVVACMTAAGAAVQAALEQRRTSARSLPLGVQVLSGGAKEAVAIALAIGGRFVRVENFVFAHVADEGLLERAEAGTLLRYRRAIGAEGVAVFADLKKKHASHAITADVTLGEAAEAALFFGAEGVIVTGTATGKPTAVRDVEEAALAVRAAASSSGGRRPVLVGSGVTPETAGALLEHADGLIVGSYYKRGGRWSEEPDRRRAEKLVRAVAAARNGRA